jgi:hypothetical protein
MSERGPSTVRLGRRTISGEPESASLGSELLRSSCDANA